MIHTSNIDPVIRYFCQVLSATQCVTSMRSDLWVKELIVPSSTHPGLFFSFRTPWRQKGSNVPTVPGNKLTEKVSPLKGSLRLAHVTKPLNESALCIRWPKYLSFVFNISPSNEHPGLISFKMNWLDLLAVQGTLKSLLQHHSSKVSILQHSAFFIVQLSHPYMTTGKTIALTRRTFVGQSNVSAF